MQQSSKGFQIFDPNTRQKSTRNLFSRQNMVEMRRKNNTARQKRIPSIAMPPKINIQKLQTLKPKNVPNRATGSLSISLKSSKSDFIAQKFKPKLGKKSLQDNPLVLGNIIKKKMKVLDQEGLDKYLLAIINANLNK